MNYAKKIKVLMAMKDLNISQLAEKSGISQSNLSKKFSKGKFSIEDMEKIALALDAKLEVFFILEDGEKI